MLLTFGGSPQGHCNTIIIYFNNSYFIIFPWKQFFKKLKKMSSLKKSQLFLIIVTANAASCYLIELPTEQSNGKAIVKASDTNIEWLRFTATLLVRSKISTEFSMQSWMSWLKNSSIPILGISYLKPQYQFFWVAIVLTTGTQWIQAMGCFLAGCWPWQHSQLPVDAR